MYFNEKMSVGSITIYQKNKQKIEQVGRNTHPVPYRRSSKTKNIANLKIKVKQ